MKKSKIDSYSLNEEHSRELMSRYCRENMWKYRRMEWDNDIDGEIEIFDDNKETTAKFIKVQLKTVDSPELFEKESDFFSYDASVKFLNFCDICDVPIILVVYNISREEGYFLFVQRYIYETLDFESPKWRDNHKKLRLHIPIGNSFTSIESKNKIEKIASKGTDLITQLRKKETAKKYYTILNQDDNSHGTALRTSIRILVEKSFATSKEAMRILLPKINEECKKKIYHRNNLLTKHLKQKTYDVIYLFFYDSLGQVNHGLPFCRTLWINEKLPVEDSPSVSEPNELIEGINIYWDKVDEFSELIENNLLDKGIYLPYVDKAFSQFDELYGKVLILSDRFASKSITYDNYIKNIKRFNKDLDKLNNLFFNFGLPPVECNDLYIKIQSLINALHNIKLVVNDTNREQSNILACIKMYLEIIETDMRDYKYERKKVR